MMEAVAVGATSTATAMSATSTATAANAAAAMTARSIFDRCGDRRTLTFISTSPGHPSGRPGTNTTNSTHLKKCVLPTATPCTIQLSMSYQVCAPQFYQRTTARSIFDRCGDRRMLTFQPALGTPSGHPDTKTTNSTHMKNVLADRRAMHNPTPHVVPGVCTAILSKNDRTVDFQAWRRPT